MVGDVRVIIMSVCFAYVQCSVHCGGGRRQRELLCFIQGQVSDAGYCDSNTRPDPMEDCNSQPCDDGQIYNIYIT